MKKFGPRSILQWRNMRAMVLQTLVLGAVYGANPPTVNSLLIDVTMYIFVTPSAWYKYVLNQNVVRYWDQSKYQVCTQMQVELTYWCSFWHIDWFPEDFTSDWVGHV